MRLRDSIGLNFAPFFLRLVLGLTFIWAGAGKFFAESNYSPEQSARLAAMGVDVPRLPSVDLPIQPDPAGVQDDSDAAGQDEQGAAQPDAEVTGQTSADESTPLAEDPAKLYPNGATLRRVYGLALLIDHAAHPGFNDDGVEPMPIWPEQLATGHWPVWAALAAGLTELIAGVVLLAGFFTRIAALSIVVVMATAMWLTEIGPAVQSGDAILGFLPSNDLYDIAAWQPLLWQLSLFSSALATMLLGAGAMSLDAVIFSGPSRTRNREPRKESDD